MKFIKINLPKKDSTIIESFAYCLTTKVLLVRFKSGPKRVYGFTNVPQEMFEEMRKADRPGKFFKQNIEGKFDYFKYARPE